MNLKQHLNGFCQNWTHVLLYVRSPLFQTTTPFAQLISDNHLTVDSMEFLDQDLDLGELGGGKRMEKE